MRGTGSGPLHSPVQLMTARSAAVLPAGKAWAFEPKFDGIRACAWWGRDGRLRLQSRQQRSLTAAFPEIVAAAEQQLPAGTVLDGELVVWRGGRLDFPALLSRLRGSSAPTPAWSRLICSPTRVSICAGSVTTCVAPGCANAWATPASRWR